MYKGFWVGNRLLRKPTHKWEDNIKINLKATNGNAWTGFIWLKTMTSGKLL
jgi:hypothetical protein